MQCEKDDLEAQKEWFNERIDRASKTKKTMELELSKFAYDFDKVEDELKAIEERSYLKRRYVTQHQSLVASQKAKAEKEAAKALEAEEAAKAEADFELAWKAKATTTAMDIATEVVLQLQLNNLTLADFRTALKEQIDCFTDAETAQLLPNATDNLKAVA